MSYRGNDSLSPEVKQRILGTFRQTLDLAAAGSVHEATLGCDFILRMDPDFEPARTLADRLEAAGGPVPVDDLRPATDGFAGKQPEASADELFDALDDLDLHQPAAARMDRGELVAQLDQRLAARDFAGVLDLARDAEDDPEVMRRASAARERQEAAPYVQRFLDSARAAASTGDLTGARGHLDKAAALDPAHPGVVDFQRRLVAAGAAGAMPQSAPPPGLSSPGPSPAAARPTSGSAAPGDRIGELLAEGQQAFERGAYQEAIDAWSRIFLIDVDHAEASQRIEEARRHKAEQEREVEEVFHDALDRLEGGDREGARRGLARVLELNPGHMAARERLDEIDREPPGAPAPMAAPAAAAAAPAQRARAADPDASGTGGWDLRQEILVPPEPGAERPATAAAKPAAAASAGRGRSTLVLLLIGGLVLVAVAAALGFLYLNRDRFFPNAHDPVAEVAAPDPISRATALHGEGKTQLALGMLRRIPAGAPQYEEAQALITQWEASNGAAGDAEPAAEGPPAEQLALREQLLAEGRQAYADGEYLLARERFDEAAEIAPLGEPEATLRAETDELLAPLSRQIALFRDGQYEFALPELWRMREESPGDPVIERLIVDSYYNLAVRDLQRGDTEEAAEKLREILELRPDDPEATRHLRFAETYAGRDEDLLYRIYVKYLPTR